jgi:hypothetical protein
VQTIQTISNQHRAVCDRYRALCSLHACGDLSPTSIRCFISDPQAKFLFNIGCCYNLMSEPGGGDEQPVPGDDCGFPMSLNVSLAGKARLLLGQAGKTLACQATAKWGTTQTFDEIMEIFKRHFFRALLQRILYDKGFAVTARQSCSSMIVVGKLRPHCYIDFPTYVCHAIARINRKHNMNINAIGIEECERYYAELKPRYFPLICGAWSMRAVLSGVIESLILVDRLLYLLEQPECDYAAIGLLPIFDPKLSPRNMMLFAVKKPI